MRSQHVEVTVDFERIRANAEAIRAQCGVGLIAVIKADAYGLGAARVADALAGVADEFAYFSLDEARQVRRPGIVLGPAEADPAAYAALRVRPTVGSRAQAERYRRVSVAIELDTGMQRFGCRAEELDDLLRISGSREVFTHADDEQAAARLAAACDGRDVRRHAAASALLDCPEASLDAVRPGLALYRGALRVTTRLVTARRNDGPAGYTRFRAARAGVILVGYSQFLQPAPVLINGRRQRIVEVGMNTAFVTLDAGDREGDEVVLVGDDLDETTLAHELGVRPHEVLCRYAQMGWRRA